MILYGDLFVLFNFAMDFCLLLVTGWIRRTEIRLWRLTIGAGVGALLALLNVYFEWSGFGYVLAKIAAASSLVSVSFRWRSLKEVLGHIGTFLLVSFALAGGIQGVSQLFAQSAQVAGVGVIATILIGGPLLFAVRQCLNWLRKGAVVGRSCIPIAIRLDGVTRSLTGFMDTGNHLYEPMTGLPVVIGEIESWVGVLPQEVLDAIRTGDLTKVEQLPYARRLRIIPYRSVGTGTHWLVGIRPEWIMVGEQVHTAVILALQSDVVHKHGAYHVILHPELT